VALVLVYPKGERLILPIHVLLVPYTIIACDWLMRGAPGVITQPAATTDT